MSGIQAILISFSLEYEEFYGTGAVLSLNAFRQGSVAFSIVIIILPLIG